MIVVLFIAIVLLLCIWGTFGLAATGQLGIAFTWIAATFLSGIVALVVIGWLVLRKLKARAASRALDDTLQKQADDQERDARPDLLPQVQEMRGEFQKAVSSLKSSKLGRSGNDALSALPWYVIIGPPGTGKSTALRNSGLKFPYLSKKGGVRGVGGTRNCDWWLTNEGIILDTAGRYVTEEDDQDEWLAFLDAVAKARPRRPINGLIVTVAASELLGLDDAGAASLGAQLRERVDEVTGRLHLLVPVYLLITKCDLIAGFVETFAHLPKSERSQTWGFTFPVGVAHDDGPGPMVQEKLDELIEVLHERATDRIAQERKLEVREKIFRFPRQFELLRGALGEVAQALFSQNPYQDTPILRGVYFTSGTQEGRPIDKVMASMAEAFGLRAPLAGSGEPPKDARSYFLGGLFTDIVFKDTRLATRSTRAVQLQKKRRYLYAATAVALSTLLIVWPLLAFFSMRAEARALVERAKDVAKVSYADDRLLRLEALRADLTRLRAEEDSAASGLWSFGMNRRDVLLRAAEPLYGRWMRDLVVKQILAHDEEALSRLPEPNAPLSRSARGQQRTEPTDQELTFERLKRHLLLSLEPRDPPYERPELFMAELQSLVGPMAADYKNLAATSTSEEELVKDLRHLFDLWPAQRQAWRFQRREDLRRKARAALADMNRTHRMLELEMRQWSKGRADLTLSLLVRDASVFESQRVVRAAFSKDAWKDAVRAALANPPSDDEAWIVGAKPASGEEVQRELQREYYVQYIREWTQFLTSIELRAVRDPNDVRRRLEVLTDPESSPLKDLFEHLQDNVLLATPLPRSRPAVPDAQSVAEAFAPLLAVRPGFSAVLKKILPGGQNRVDLELYEGRLKDFAKAVDSAKDAASSAGVAKTLRMEATNLSSVIAGQGHGELYETVLEQLWVRPVRRMADALDSGTRQELNFKWCGEVFSLHHTELHNRYPFSRTGQDADLATMVQLYNAKDGKLVAFYKDNLNTRVGDRGQDYVRIGGESVEEGLLAFLNHAKTLRDAVFPSDSQDPMVDFTVQLHPPPSPTVLGVSFLMDDQQARQDTGPLEEPFPMHWPGGPKGPKRAVLSVALKGTKPKLIGCHGEQECSGPFALFRLIEQGKILKQGPRSFTLSWPVDLGGPEGVTNVTADIAWTRSVSPFFGREGPHARPLLAVFRELDPPRAIVPGVEACQ